MCFVGHYRNKTKNDFDDNEQHKDIDIFNMIAIALCCGISYEALSKMNFVMLQNIVDALGEKTKKKPTQAQIDSIV